MKKRSSTPTRSQTDWRRVRAMRDEDIDTSDIPELGPDFFARATLWHGPKRQLTLRIDPDVLEFYKKTGKRYQTLMNSALRAQMARMQAASAPKRRRTARKKAG